MTRSIKFLFLSLSSTLAACGIHSTESDPPVEIAATPLLEYSGFAAPERVLYDAERDRYLVSNVNGDAALEDDNGFISVLSPEGEVTNLKWIEGGRDGVTLSAPKGLAISNGVLYVADITTVRLFDAETGASLGDVPLSGSTFVNGVSAAPEGKVYVSDSGPPQGTLDGVGTEAVYIIENGQATKLASGPLGRPTSVAWTREGLLVTPFGANEVYRLDGNGKKRSATALPAGGLAGVVQLGEWLYVTSWQASSILRGRLGGKFEVALADLTSPTDFAYDDARARFIVPSYTEDKVSVFETTAKH